MAAVRGLTVLADAALPSSLSLLPAELKTSLPRQVLARHSFLVLFTVQSIKKRAISKSVIFYMSAPSGTSK